MIDIKDNVAFLNIMRQYNMYSLEQRTYLNALHIILKNEEVPLNLFQLNTLKQKYWLFVQSHKYAVASILTDSFKDLLTYPRTTYFNMNTLIIHILIHFHLATFESQLKIVHLNYNVLTYYTTDGDFNKTLLYEPRYLLINDIIQIYREFTVDQYYRMCTLYSNNFREIKLKDAYSLI